MSEQVNQAAAAVQPEHRSEEQRMDRMYHFLYAVIWPFFNFFHPVKVIGRENIPDGPAVICPNHPTAGDPF